jgi:hypothetical protein
MLAVRWRGRGDRNGLMQAIKRSADCRRDDGAVEWQDRLVEEGSDQESRRNSGARDPQDSARSGAHGPRRPRPPHLRGAPAGRFANHA